MTKKEVGKLKPNDEINHKRYGKSKVKEVVYSFTELFGVVITPITDDGLKLLAYDSGTNITDFMEDSIRALQAANFN